MQNPPAKPYRILIIEDDLELGRIIKEILELEGFETEIIRDGAQAYAAVASKMPALVVLDMQLPYVSGLDILEHIRADVHLQNMKVLVTTDDQRWPE